MIKKMWCYYMCIITYMYIYICIHRHKYWRRNIVKRNMDWTREHDVNKINQTQNKISSTWSDLNDEIQKVKHKRGEEIWMIFRSWISISGKGEKLIKENRVSLIQKIISSNLLASTVTITKKLLYFFSKLPKV